MMRVLSEVTSKAINVRNVERARARRGRCRRARCTENASARARVCVYCVVVMQATQGAATAVPRDNITQGLSVMANVCFEMVLNKRFDSDTTNMFCLRAMTGNVVVRARLLSLCVCLCVFFFCFYSFCGVCRRNFRRHYSVRPHSLAGRVHQEVAN